MLRLEEIGADLDRQAAGDLRHGLEKGIGPVRSLDGLVGDPQNPLLQEHAGELGARSQMEVGEQGLAFADHGELRGQGLLDLEDEVGLPPIAPRPTPRASHRPPGIPRR